MSEHHYFSDYWRSGEGRNKLLYPNLPTSPTMDDYRKRLRYRKPSPSKYGKTIGVYNPKFKRIKKGNKVKFEKGERVHVGGRQGIIDDSYQYDGVIFYRIEWDEVRLTWYDKYIGQEPSKFGWSESRLIGRVDA